MERGLRVSRPKYYDDPKPMTGERLLLRGGLLLATAVGIGALGGWNKLVRATDRVAVWPASPTLRAARASRLACRWWSVRRGHHVSPGGPGGFSARRNRQRGGRHHRSAERPGKRGTEPRGVEPHRQSGWRAGRVRRPGRWRALWRTRRRSGQRSRFPAGIQSAASGIAGGTRLVRQSDGSGARARGWWRCRSRRTWWWRRSGRRRAAIGGDG